MFSNKTNVTKISKMKKQLKNKKKYEVKPYFANVVKRIPLQGCSLCSSFVLTFSLIVPTTFLQENTDTKSSTQFGLVTKNTSKNNINGYLCFSCVF